MYCETYIRVDDIAETEDIINSLPEPLKGNFKDKKAMVNQEAIITSQYWVSKMRELPDTNCRTILQEVKELVGEYNSYFNQTEIQTAVCIHIRFATIDEVGGVYLDNELIHALSAINASVDVDEYMD